MDIGKVLKTKGQVFQSLMQI